MFQIEEARERAVPPKPSFLKVLDLELSDAMEDMRKALNQHTVFAGMQCTIPIHVTKVMPQRRCSESMLGRLHDWEFTYTTARRCWNCEGRLETYDRDYGFELCDSCIGGWIPEEWHFHCKRCKKGLTKGGLRAVV